MVAREASVWSSTGLFSTAGPGRLQIFWRWLAGPRASASPVLAPGGSFLRSGSLGAHALPHADPALQNRPRACGF